MEPADDCEIETVGPVRAAGVGAAMTLAFSDLVKEWL